MSRWRTWSDTETPGQPLAGAPGDALTACGLVLARPAALTPPRQDGNFLAPYERAEPAALAGSDELAVRAAGTLSLKTVAGPVVLANRDACGQNGGVVSDATCMSFVYRGHDAAHHGFLVLVGFFRGDEYAWVDDRSGHVTALQGEPHFSPSGRTLVLVRASSSDGFNGIQLWSAEGLTPVWQYAPRSDVLYRFDRWNGEDRIVLRTTSMVRGKAIEGRARLTKTPAGWKLRPAP